MAFHETRLPEDVERGAQGGPKFKTTVLELDSGFEQRNIDWSEARGEWDVGYGIESKADYVDVVAFFRARYGRAHGFRFKDWTDFEMARQTIGTGDGVKTVFQVFKRYSSGGVDYDRILKKLVAGTVQVWKAGVLQSVGFTINLNAGTVTFSVAPSGGQVIEAECEFDVPVRFDTDHLKVTAETFDAGSIPSIPVVELRI